MSEKRILIFSLSYYPDVGGAEVAIRNITDRVRGIEFHLITLRFSDEPRRERIGNVEVYRVGFGGTYLAKILFVPLAVIKARSLHRKEKFDAAWAMMTYMLFPLALARLSGMRLPYALTLQDGDPFGHVFNRWFILPFRPLLPWGFRHAAVVQAISTFLGTWSRQMGFPGPLEIIPNGVDTATFLKEPSEDKLRPILNKINKEPGDVFLVTTSRLVHKNAIDDIVRALAKLPKHIKCIVVGSGPEGQKLKSLARAHGVSERMYFLGHVEYADILLYLKVSDIFIRPSRSEGMGNSFIEAMAAGLPVIATQEGGIADFLFDAKRNPEKPATGFAVDKDAPLQIAETVTYILAHSNEVKQTIKNARKLVAEKYDWNRVALDMKTKVFDKLLGA